MSSLTVDDWKQGPNYPHSWVAVARGRNTCTLTITADGKPVVLGTVTVVASRAGRSASSMSRPRDRSLIDEYLPKDEQVKARIRASVAALNAVDPGDAAGYLTVTARRTRYGSRLSASP